MATTFTYTTTSSPAWDSYDYVSAIKKYKLKMSEKDLALIEEKKKYMMKKLEMEQQTKAQPII